MAFRGCTMDRFDQQTRSRVMSAVRGRDTSPELAVRKMVHSMGYRFRLHRKDLPGTPDLVFPKLKLALFVHGCFWHQHRGCAKSKRPTTNETFWNNKLSANIARDDRVQSELSTAGWRVHTIWECETKDKSKLSIALQDAISSIADH